jgi:hypothetical protein
MLNILSEIKEFRTHLRPEYNYVKIHDLSPVTIGPVGPGIPFLPPEVNTTTAPVVIGPTTFC